MTRTLIIIFLVLGVFAKTPAQVPFDPAELLNNAITPAERIDAYKNIFRHYEYSHPDSAKLFLRKGMLEFTKSGDRIGIGSMTILEGYMDADQGKRAQAKQNISVR